MMKLSQLIGEIGRNKSGAPLFFLAILAMVMLPMPPLALDMLFTFNIVLALIITLVSVSARRPLDFSIFPTIILATTLLRLSLNVASTRVVLLHGHEGGDAAGRVIEAFGNVVIGGNFVVGAVVFVILMIINFIVVTKGAERISEVSARFTLDALPGKQMAIDADLNAGLINQEQAQQRRRDISAEADFYGAMDGASKFVRGDAIAGILILLINLFGGVAIGILMHGLSAGEAFRQYALLTIGDGLVAQIPALLLSSAAAIIVTRINDDGDMQQLVGKQMLASPTVILSAGFMLLVLALIPGMPWPTFAGAAALLGYISWRLYWRQQEQPVPAVQQQQQAVLAEPAPLRWETLPLIDPVSIRIGYGLVGLLQPQIGTSLPRRALGVSQTLSEQFGFLLPPPRIKDYLRLNPNDYEILLFGNRMVAASIHPDRLMAIPSLEVYGELDGIPDTDPTFGLPVTWIRPEDKANALAQGYQVVDGASVISTHLNQVLRQNLPELLQLDDAGAMGERLNSIAPRLATALNNALSPVQQLRIYRQLLADQVSLINLPVVAQALIDGSELSKDPIVLAAEVRTVLKRQIMQTILRPDQPLHVHNLSRELEQMLLDALSHAQKAGNPPLDNFPLPPNILQQLQTLMPQIRDQMKQAGQSPVLLVTPQLRPMLARYARLFATGLHVLSYNEVPDQLDISLIGALG